MTIRVCFIIPTLDRGGAEKQLCLLAAHLDRQRFAPQVVTLTRGGPREATLKSADVPVTHLHKRGKFDPMAIWRLLKCLRKLQPDVVHTWLFAGNAYGRTAALVARVPVIIGGERCVDSWKSPWHFMIDRFLAKRSSCIATNSSGVRDFYAQHGIAADRFVIIPNGIEERSVSNISREEACRRMNVDPNRKVIGSVGRLSLQKGYKDLIWAGELLRVLREDISYVIIGDGPERQRLEHYRDQTRSAEQLRFLGERDDVAELLPHFDLIWNGSHYEGQSNSIIEAMQAGVPVIATDIPGNRDLVVPKVTGDLFPLGDVGRLTQLSHQLLETTELRRAMGQAARHRIANEFSVDKMVTLHEELYERLVKSAAKR